MDEQNKNLILATALSFLVIMVWTVFFSPTQQDVPTAPDQQSQSAAPEDGLLAEAPPSGSEGDAGLISPVAEATDRAAALQSTPRIKIETPRLRGSLSLVGGRIDDLSFADYRDTLDPGSDLVRLLSPAGGPKAYYALYGWTGAGDISGHTPNAQTEWTAASDAALTVESPVTLTWISDQGVEFERIVSVDENYLFSVTQTVRNTTNQSIRLRPYGIIARRGEPETIGFYILHEGVVQATDGEIAEIDYDDMPDFAEKEGAGVVNKVDVENNGWIGFTDKYWMTTLIPDPGQKFTAAAKYTNQSTTYQADMRLPIVDVPPGGTEQVSTSLFAGAKEWEAIRDYEQNNGFAQFVDSIDWGWFFFLTKPMFQVLHYLNALIGNMGWAIIGLTVVIKLLLLPLAYKSYVSMAKMKNLQPEMEKIKERTGDDKQKLQQEMMALYKKEKVNPASGCLPILVQIPIFFSLYKVIFVTLELRHAPFFGWIQDLSAPDPTSVLNLFGALPYEIPAILGIISIGIWPILMGITMWLQQKLNPAPTDATQAMIFAWMPWVFMFMLGGFASGLVIYWVANNTITFIQQYAIMRSQGMTPDVFGNVLASFKKNKEPDE